MARLDGITYNAGCSVTGGTGAAVSAEACSTARTGAGVYTVTLDQPLDATQSRCHLAIKGATDLRGVVEHTSDSVKTIRTFTGAAVATDADFDFDIYRV